MSTVGRQRPFKDLPGEDLVTGGIEDLAAGRNSAAALLVSLAAPRLEALGVAVPTPAGATDRPAHQLYDLLADEGSDSAHSRYNALIGRMASFCRAAERASAR
ncbi:MAG: hypothetical protein H0V29_11545 [Thermoleophilaceae bacterium]|nr:hypothetical protein [Thermoleophilaceae bacterium]